MAAARRSPPAVTKTTPVLEGLAPESRAGDSCAGAGAGGLSARGGFAGSGAGTGGTGGTVSVASTVVCAPSGRVTCTWNGAVPAPVAVILVRSGVDDDGSADRVRLYGLAVDLHQGVQRSVRGQSHDDARDSLAQGVNLLSRRPRDVRALRVGGRRD